MSIEIFDESDDDRGDWYSDKESNDPKEMLRDCEDHEGDEYRKMNKRGDDFWIEIVGFEHMDETDHDYRAKYGRQSSVAIGDDDYRNAREDRPKNRNKPKNKHNECECDHKWERSTSVYETDNNQSECGHESIDECDDRLCSEYESESSTNLPSQNSWVIVEKSKIAIAHFF